MAADDPVTSVMSVQVVSVERSTPVLDVARLMVEHGISGVPVVDGDRVVGMVTERDMVAQEMDVDAPVYGTFLDAVFRLPWDKSDEEFRHVLATTAGQLMSSDVVTISASSTVRDAASVMYKRRLNPLPVVDSAGRLVGIVSRSDIIRMLAEI
ncbi:MAG: CBS domain-containing protein [Thermomicrobiales bacterium]